eukprot:scaffold619_cov368-Pavlova_lutheri.AAC.10
MFFGRSRTVALGSVPKCPARCPIYKTIEDNDVRHAFATINMRVLGRVENSLKVLIQCACVEKSPLSSYNALYVQPFVDP